MCYYIAAAPIEDGHEEKNSPGVAEPHSVRCKLAAHLAPLRFHSQLMENLSCDVFGMEIQSFLQVKR